MDRNLDGVYFRVKRGESYENVCFSDLTEEEMDEVLSERSDEWLRSLAKILGQTIKKIGDQFQVMGR